MSSQSRDDAIREKASGRLGMSVLRDMEDQFRTIVSFRPRGVFISSRMIELSADRAVAYRAVAQAGMQPVLFEREPEPGIRGDWVREKMNHMIISCPYMAALYHRSCGSHSPSPIEYELLGHLCENARKNSSNPEEYDPNRWQSSTEENTTSLVRDLQGFYNSRRAERVYIFLKHPHYKTKLHQIGSSSEVADFFDNETYQQVEFRNIKILVSNCVALENVWIYHSLDDLQRQMSRLKERDQDRQVDEACLARRFSMTVVGPDFPGLLVSISEFLMCAGANVEYVYHNSARSHLALEVMATVLCKTSDDHAFRHDLNLLAGTLQHQANERLSAYVSVPERMSPLMKSCSVDCVPLPRGQSQQWKRVELSVVDTPGILFEISRVIHEAHLNITNIHLGSTRHCGTPQTAIHMVCIPETPGTESEGLWALVESRLINLIGVNAVTILDWEIGSSRGSYERRRLNILARRSVRHRPSCDAEDKPEVTGATTESNRGN